MVKGAFALLFLLSKKLPLKLQINGIPLLSIYSRDPKLWTSSGDISTLFWFQRQLTSYFLILFSSVSVN